MTSGSVLRRVAGGESAAVAECLDRYGGLVWSLARGLLGSGPDAEDAVQEIFIDLWKHAARYDESLGSEVNFVGVIARRRLVDRRRKLARRPPADSLEADVVDRSAEPGRSLETADEVSRARQALAELQPEQRQVLTMAVCEGVTHDEIARRTALPLGTVKTWVRRGLIAVREKLTAGNGRRGVHESR